ncbi:MAG: M20 family metallopeptidase [Clostridium sp.]|nr:M20 family metallopeptidase [Clostridium sp.]MDU7085083.1 M20 family metallopeptidase [Clostridium sp.]
MNHILKSAKDMENQIIADRRAIHENPEVGHELPKTTAYVKQRLEEMGIEAKEICKSGIVATIGKGEKTILLRADMDALPMQEINELSFKSQNNNAHTCGHDMHTAMLLGAAKLLKDREAELKGMVKLMFQPAEEFGTGAKSMIETGLLENPKVNAAIGLHVMPDIDKGVIEYKQGITSSFIDGFTIEVQGKGGHSSTPHTAIDPINILNSIYNNLNSLVSKEINPFETAVLTIGKFIAGDLANIIPDSGYMQGTLRCFSRETRNFLMNRLNTISTSVAASLRGECKVTSISTPAVDNNSELCEFMVPYVEEVIGKENVRIKEKPLSGSEDFSYVAEAVPSMFMFLGTGDKDSYPVHNPHVFFNESVLHKGTAILANCAINWLERN